MLVDETSGLLEKQEDISADSHISIKAGLTQFEDWESGIASPHLWGSEPAGGVGCKNPESAGVEFDRSERPSLFGGSSVKMSPKK